MGLFSAQLYPGRALGFLVLGASLHDVLTRLKAEPQTFPTLSVTYSPSAPVTDPVLLSLPSNGLRLRFDGPTQRLRLIEITEFSKNHVTFKDRDLVRPPPSDQTSTSQVPPAGTSASGGGPTFRHIYNRLLGPTYGGEYIPPSSPADKGLGKYVLSYPGVAFTFPLSESSYSPDKDVVSLLSAPTSQVALSMALFSGDSWTQARDRLWTDPLPSIKGFAPLSKSNKDVCPEEVSLVRIHGAGKLELVQGWSSPSSSTGGGPGVGGAGGAGGTATPGATSSLWITLGETTPQDLVAELGAPDAIYRKNDQRMYIHKIRSSSNTRPGGGNGRADLISTSGPRRDELVLTDTDQSSAHTTEDDDYSNDDEAVEDDFLTGNVSGECFFNYFYLGFDVLVSTPLPPSRRPPLASGPGGQNGQIHPAQEGENGVNDFQMKSDSPDRLVATKFVIHNNVPGSYPFNRHRRCRWELAYLPPSPPSLPTEATVAMNSETQFPALQSGLRALWASAYGSEDEAKKQQRGMVLNRGWGDSPGSSCELLGGWEGDTNASVTFPPRHFGGGDPGTGGRKDGVGAGGEDSTTTLYGFPGLVFEVLANGHVSALTVF